MNDNEIGNQTFFRKEEMEFISSFIEQYKTKLWIMHMEMVYDLTLTPEI